MDPFGTLNFGRMSPLDISDYSIGGTGVLILVICQCNDNNDGRVLMLLVLMERWEFVLAEKKEGTAISSPENFGKACGKFRSCLGYPSTPNLSNECGKQLRENQLEGNREKT